MTSEDDLLRSLASHDVAPQRAEHIRRRGHALLRERERRQNHPLAAWWSSCYGRYLEPAALIAFGLCYVAWTVQDAVAMFH
jgi:hypothetical protein